MNTRSLQLSHRPLQFLMHNAQASRLTTHQPESSLLEIWATHGATRGRDCRRNYAVAGGRGPYRPSGSTYSHGFGAFLAFHTSSRDGAFKNPNARL